MSNKAFKHIVKTHQLDRDTYPYSEKGQKLLTGLLKHFFIALITGAIGVGLLIGHTHIEDVRYLTDEEIEQKQEEIEQKKAELEKQRLEDLEYEKEYGVKPMEVSYLENLLYNLTGIDISGKINDFKSDEELIASGEERSLFLFIVKSAMNILGRITLTLTIISLIIFSFRVLQYVRILLKRQRFYERKVIINDIKADLFRRRFLGSVDIKSRYRDFKQDLQHKKSNNKNFRLSVDDKNKKEMYRMLLDTKVFINTRNSIEVRDMIDTQYRIYIDTGRANKEQLDMVRKEVESWGEEATRLMRGSTSFSTLFMSKTQDSISFRALKREVDPYVVQNTVADVDENIEYEFVYPANIFTDNQAAIDEKHDEAYEWMQSALTNVQGLLSTKKISATALPDESSLTANSVLFKFDLPETSALPDTHSLAELIDTNFRDVGSSVMLRGGRIEVIIPLPDEYKSGINVPTLLRQVFGEGHVVKGDHTVDEEQYTRGKNKSK